MQEYDKKEKNLRFLQHSYTVKKARWSKNSLPYTLDTIYYASFFQSNADTKIMLGVSEDGVNFGDLIELKNEGKHLFGRDPSIIYYAGYFLIAVTNMGLNSHDFVIYRSQDLVHWQTVKCKMGDSPVADSKFGDILHPQIWAPEFILDENNDLYIGISIQSKENEPDETGTPIPYFSCCISKCIDVNILTFGYPDIINIEEDHINNKIDPHILYDNNEYILSVKNEFSKVIELFKSDALLNKYIYVATIPFAKPAEGSCIVKGIEDDYIIYADFYGIGCHYFYVRTQNFMSFSQERSLIENVSLRHGTVAKTSDPAAIQCLLNITNMSLG